MVNKEYFDAKFTCAIREAVSSLKKASLCLRIIRIYYRKFMLKEIQFLSIGKVKTKTRKLLDKLACFQYFQTLIVFTSY